MRRLFADRDARLYICGQSLSLLGDTSLWLACGIWVKTLTHSNAKAGLVFFFFALASLFAPIAGMIVDRVRRRLLIVAVNYASAGAVLLLLLVHRAADVWIVYVVMVLYGISGSLLSSAQSALLTVLLPEELLGDANASLTTVREGLRLVAPLVGAGLFVIVGGGWIAVIDAGTFVVAGSTTLALHLREPKPERSREPFLPEVAAGFRHVLGTPVLRRMSIALAVALLVVGFSETAVFGVIASGLHRPPSFLGVILAVQGVGALAGGFSAAATMRRVGEVVVVGMGLLLGGIGSLLFATGQIALVFAGAVIFGVAVPWLVVGSLTLIQRKTPAALQGRAFSAFDLMASLPQTISIGVGALIIGVVGYRVELVTMAIVIGLSSLILFIGRERGDAPGLEPVAEEAAAA